MSKQIMLTLPEQVYDQVEQMARADSRAVEDVLAEVIKQSVSIFSIDPDRPAMLREQAAYRAMHSDLLEKYEGQFVAVYQGQVIDHDANDLALSERVRQRLPSGVVLICQVLPQPERVLYFRSPHLVRA